MSTEENLPEDWMLETEQTTHDELMGRDYTTVLYRQEHTRSAVYINEVIDGANVWEYNVHHSGRDSDLGTAADLETAKQIAFEFMNDSAASV
ncbi:hypothetical protein [Halococcus saccharolyticus]|uniref:Uncharacterized protein n=1 Tax=Halococcus saccharolyticus DSM 5350 TaxID=1227455 RepID=M0MCZ1_9EURY|nr:hypothetical protein [Halococcus saccharolyticus]EMA43637.1 hypothetical protein C449_13797 [Halococcus saccharolyticus DSM 5350]